MWRIVVIDDTPLEEARRALGTKGVRDTVETGLKEAIRRRRLEELLCSLGKVDLDLIPEELARLRNERLLDRCP
jgi:Bacterial antitoxin of type II TA system, VapB